MPVSTTHPRIWITPATLPALKARAVPTGDRWSPVLIAATVQPADWNTGIVNYALAWQMTNNPVYAQRAWDLMSQSMVNGVNQVTPDSGYQCRNFFPASAICYDWLHEWMTPAQKAQLQASIETCADWVWPETNPSRKGQWGVDDPGNNYYHGFLFTWMAGLALAGESLKAQGYLDNARRRWDTEVTPYLNTQAQGGLFAEGTGYGTASTGFILWNLLAHLSAAGEDLADVPGLTFLPEMAMAMGSFTNPAMRELAPFGDLGAGPINDYHRRVALCLSQFYHTERAWLDGVTPSRNLQRLTQWEEFLFYPSSAAVNVALPTFYSAPGIGAISSRTGWGKADTQLLAVCGPTTQSHQDRAQGSFYLFNGDWLAASAKMFSHSGIRQDAVDHNCLTVDGQRQTQTQGGCRYLQQEDTPAYAYLAMDLAAAYAGQLSTYRRELFWLKPNLLVVRDVFTPANPTAVISHNLNVLEQPALDLAGGFAVVAPGGNKLFGIAADWKFISRQAMLDQSQTTPTYQLVLTGAGAPRYCVGLEVAAPPQGARTVTPYASTALQGMVRGSDLVAAVTLPPPLTYTSPASGNHWLSGLKPSTVYTVNDIQWTTSPAGVLHAPGPPVGSVVTVSEGLPVPPPTPKGRTFLTFVPEDGSPATISEVPPSARPTE